MSRWEEEENKIQEPVEYSTDTKHQNQLFKEKSKFDSKIKI